jgi:hypothetical protein
MKKNIPLKDEAFALTETTVALFESVLGDFVKYCTSRGCFKISKESARFVATIKLERKKDAK